ncbi:MAG: hypothetical protein QOD83_197 [Solirubrobacteraceae bacterium]|jgi:hypothetical protein|nr:hypothetical protein [Solirubrobacteraceae bacterium]
MVAAAKQSCGKPEVGEGPTSNAPRKDPSRGVENVSQEQMKSLGGSRRDERRFAPTRIGWTR